MADDVFDAYDDNYDDQSSYDVDYKASERVGSSRQRLEDILEEKRLMRELDMDNDYFDYA